jgi:hypothetical protein
MNKTQCKATTTVTRFTFTEQDVVHCIRQELKALGVLGANAAVIEFEVSSQGFLRGAEAVIIVTEVGNE